MLTNESIRQRRQAIEDLKQENIDEDRTRVVLVSPILRSLGWNDENHKRVITQYRIPQLQNDNDGKVDYALIDENKDPVVFVEAKRLGNNLGGKELEQIRRYGSDHILNKGIRNVNRAFIVLTNGDVWKFYLLWHEKGGLSYYRGWEYELSIERGDILEVTENLNKLLAYQEVRDGESQRHLVNLFLQHRIKEIYKSILSEPDEELVNLVARRMKEKGYELNQEEIKRVILEGGTPLPPPPIPPPPPSPPSPSPPGVKGLRVEYGGEIFEGNNATVVLGDALNLIAKRCGIEKVCEVCEGKALAGKIPLVMTENQAKAIFVMRRGVSIPIHHESVTKKLDKSGNYRFYHNMAREGMAKRLNRLTDVLGISDQVKVYLDGKLFTGH